MIMERDNIYKGGGGLPTSAHMRKNVHYLYKYSNPPKKTNRPMGHIAHLSNSTA